MTSRPLAAVGHMLGDAFANVSFIATVSAVAGGRVFIVRPGQHRPENMGYESVVDVTTLQAGDRVSVLQHGGSLLIMGKLSTTAVPPIAIPPPNVASGCYLGVLPYPDPSDVPSLIATQLFQQEVERTMALVGTERTFGQAVSPSALSTIALNGSTPVLTWSPVGVPLADILAGTWDAYLTAQATTLQAFGKPVFVRWAPDMNAASASWSGDGAAYAAAWQYVQAKVKAVAVQTVWVWTPYVWGGSDATVAAPFAYYPGDDFVDWVGLDGYNSQRLFGEWLTFSELFGFSYGQMVSSFAKPLLLGGWGCDNDDRKAAWFTEALGTELPQFFPKLGAELYTNQDQTAARGLGADWRVDSNAPAAAAVAAALASAYYLSGVH